MDESNRTRLLRAMLAHLGRADGAATGTLAPAAAPLPAAALKARLSPAQWAAATRVLAGHPLNSALRDQLFAIVQPLGRPAIVVKDGDFDAGPPWRHFAAAPIHDRLRNALRAVGRIEIPGDAVSPRVGTGFLVADRLVMTNRHVAKNFVTGLGTPAMRFRDGMAPVINFRREFTSPASDTSAQVAIAAVDWIHPAWDMVLLRLGTSPANVTPLTFAQERLAPQSEIAVLGYPGRLDPSADPERHIYVNIYDVKRLLPGQAHGMVSTTHAAEEVLQHDSFTLPGSSGSPVLDAGTGLVVGLHFHGDGTINYAVPSNALAVDAAVRQRVTFDG